MAGLFGTMGGLQGALGGMFAGGGVPMPEPQKPSGGGSGGRRGLFGGRPDPATAQQFLVMAQAAMHGDYGTVAQMTAQMQRNRLVQEQAAAEREDEEAQYLSAHQALSAQGLDKNQIFAMRPEERSSLLRDQLQPRQFGAEGGSLLNPVTGQFTRAPSQRQVGRTIVDMPNGNDPTPIYEGVEPVVTPDGGNMYGMYGDGSFRNPDGTRTSQPMGGDVPEPPQAAPQMSEQQLRAAAQNAIQQGADPAAVERRLQEQLRALGGASPAGSRTFPPGLIIGGQQFPFP